jgi:hypothetical protein
MNFIYQEENGISGKDHYSSEGNLSWSHIWVENWMKSMKYEV